MIVFVKLWPRRSQVPQWLPRSKPGRQEAPRSDPQTSWVPLQELQWDSGGTGAAGTTVKEETLASCLERLTILNLILFLFILINSYSICPINHVALI